MNITSDRRHIDLVGETYNEDVAYQEGREMGHTILCIDSHPHILELLDFNFSRAGFDVITVHEMPMTVNAQVVILGLLIDSNIAEQIKACRRIAPSVPLVVLSPSNETVDRFAAIRAGADHYIPMPFSIRELVSLMHSLNGCDLEQSLG